jgi:hypothetical protein
VAAQEAERHEAEAAVAAAAAAAAEADAQRAQQAVDEIKGRYGAWRDGAADAAAGEGGAPLWEVAPLVSAPQRSAVPGPAGLRPGGDRSSAAPLYTHAPLAVPRTRTDPQMCSPCLHRSLYCPAVPSPCGTIAWRARWARCPCPRTSPCCCAWVTTGGRTRRRCSWHAPRQARPRAHQARVSAAAAAWRAGGGWATAGLLCLRAEPSKRGCADGKLAGPAKRPPHASRLPFLRPIVPPLNPLALSAPLHLLQSGGRPRWWCRLMPPCWTLWFPTMSIMTTMEERTTAWRSHCRAARRTRAHGPTAC